MEKNIKYYIHMYLGCKVKYKEREYYLEGFHKHGIDYGHNWIFIFNDADDCFWVGTKDIKLILRHLSNMSEEEWRDIETNSSIIPDAWGYNLLRDEFLIGTDKLRCHWSIVNEALIELRKRGIDCDDLIESGLAIDEKMISEKV